MNDPRTGTDNAYPYLRQCLAPQFAGASPAAIEAYMDERFGRGGAEHYDDALEGFWDDLGHTFDKVAPIVANVAGGVARGAMSGSALGLPGIIGGAVLGGAGTALGSYAKGPLGDVGKAINTGTQLAGQFTPMGRIGNQVGSAVSGLGQGHITPQRLLQQGLQFLPSGGGAGGSPLAGFSGLLGGGGAGAAGQLSSLLGRPEMQQALMSLMMGSAGRRTVPVGAQQTPVPTTAIAGLLQSLAAQAIDEAAAESDGSESDLTYMADAAGEFVGDPSEDDDRAARVWDLLNAAQLDRLASIAQAQQAAAAWRRARPAPELPAEAWHDLVMEDLLADFDEADDGGEADFGEDAWLDTKEAAYDDL